MSTNKKPTEVSYEEARWVWFIYDVCDAFAVVQVCDVLQEAEVVQALDNSRYGNDKELFSHNAPLRAVWEGYTSNGLHVQGYPDNRPHGAYLRPSGSCQQTQMR